MDPVAPVRVVLVEPVTLPAMRAALHQINGASGVLVLVDAAGAVLNEMFVSVGPAQQLATA